MYTAKYACLCACLIGLGTMALEVPAYAETSVAQSASLTVIGIVPDENGGYNTRKVLIPYNGIDNTDVHGAAEFYVRIDMAAASVCLSPSLRRITPQLREKIEQCRVQARSDAVSRAGVPALIKAAEIAANTPRPVP